MREPESLQEQAAGAAAKEILDGIRSIPSSEKILEKLLYLTLEDNLDPLRGVRKRRKRAFEKMGQKLEEDLPKCFRNPPKAEVETGFKLRDEPVVVVRASRCGLNIQVALLLEGNSPKPYTLTITTEPTSATLNTLR